MVRPLKAAVAKRMAEDVRIVDKVTESVPAVSSTMSLADCWAKGLCTGYCFAVNYQTDGVAKYRLETIIVIIYRQRDGVMQIVGTQLWATQHFEGPVCQRIIFYEHVNYDDGGARDVGGKGMRVSIGGKRRDRCR